MPDLTPLASSIAIPVDHHRVNRSKSVKPIIQSEIAFDNRPSSDIFLFIPVCLDERPVSQEEVDEWMRSGGGRSDANDKPVDEPSTNSDRGN